MVDQFVEALIGTAMIAACTDVNWPLPSAATTTFVCAVATGGEAKLITTSAPQKNLNGLKSMLMTNVWLRAKPLLSGGLLGDRCRRLLGGLRSDSTPCNIDKVHEQRALLFGRNSKHASLDRSGNKFSTRGL